jgi:hypothetical protein
MSETRQPIQFRLRHVLLIVTLLCMFLALCVIHPMLAIIVFTVAFVGGGMACISTRSPRRWIVGPIFGLYFGVLGMLLGILLTFGPNPIGGPLLAIAGVCFGGWFAGRLERKHSLK